MDPFLFRAFKLGVAKILNEFEPGGEIGTPKRVDALVAEIKEMARGAASEKRHVKYAESILKRWKSPASAGTAAADETLSDFFRGPAHSPDEIRQMWTPIGSSEPDRGPIAKENFMQTDRTWYGMEQARKTLGIAKPKPETTKPKDKRQ
jgi:hypothetical protein